MTHAAGRHFEVDLDWIGAGDATLRSGSQGPLRGAAAAPDAAWPAEPLLLASLSLSLMRTFLELARREELAVARYRTHAEATLSRTPNGLDVRLGLTLVTVHVEVGVAPPDARRAQDLMVQAKQVCVVANALMPPVHLDLVVESVSSADRELVGAARS